MPAKDRNSRLWRTIVERLMKEHSPLGFESQFVHSVHSSLCSDDDALFLFCSKPDTELFEDYRRTSQRGVLPPSPLLVDFYCSLTTPILPFCWLPSLVGEIPVLVHHHALMLRCGFVASNWIWRSLEIVVERLQNEESSLLLDNIQVVKEFSTPSPPSQ